MMQLEKMQPSLIPEGLTFQLSLLYSKHLVKDH